MRSGSVAFAAFLLASSTAWAATGDPLIVTGDGVNVRFEPSTESRIKMRVYRNQQVIELQRQGEWVRAEIAGTAGEEGWIHGSLLAPPDGDPLAPPPGASAPSTARATPAAAPATPSPETATEPPRPLPRPVLDPALGEEQEQETPVEVTATPEPVPDEEVRATAPTAAAGTAGVTEADGPPAIGPGEQAALPEPAAGPDTPSGADAGPGADLAGLARFRESVDYLNSRALEVAGVDLFTDVEPVGGGVVQVVATDAFSTVPPAGQRSYLNTLIDRWVAATGGEGPVSVQIVDDRGRVVMERTGP